MFSLASDTNESPDVAGFLGELNRYQARTTFFDVRRDIFLARAPGRLDLMGGIADYSGSLVLQYPLAAATFAAIQKTRRPKIEIVSLKNAAANDSLQFEISLDELNRISRDYKIAREFFAANPNDAWAAYVAGIFVVLARERGANFADGARILIASDVPEGAGISSSAALETATMQAVCAAFNIRIEARESALLCQKCENAVVGALCGVMDQTVSACGEANKLLALVCQPAELKGAIALPANVEVWGVDSGVRHRVAGADYGSVRAGAFIGYRIIADIANLAIEKLVDGKVKIKDERWRGYLANIAPAEFERESKDKLPQIVSGAEFLKKYGGTTDSVSTIESDKTYSVLAPTAHPIYENARVQKFANALAANEITDDAFAVLGELMFASHQSYTACGLGSAETDWLVEAVKNENAKKELFGAKITGGGSGGTVAILGKRGAGAAVKAIAVAYERETGRRARIFSGSSPGAFRFGVRRLIVSL